MYTTSFSQYALAFTKPNFRRIHWHLKNLIFVACIGFIFEEYIGIDKISFSYDALAFTKLNYFRIRRHLKKLHFRRTHWHSNLFIFYRIYWHFYTPLCLYNFMLVCGLQYIWYSQGYNINIHWLKEYSLMIYKDQFQQEWHDSIHNSNKCLVYRMFKTEFRFEKYLTSIPFKLRNLFTKFRCRSTRLPIESGVFVGIKRDDRVCTFSLLQDAMFVSVISFFDNILHCHLTLLHFHRI